MLLVFSSTTILVFLIYFLCTAVGKKFLKKIQFTDNYCLTSSLAYFIGFGSLINLLLLLCLIGQFKLYTLVSILVFLSFFFLKNIFQDIIFLFKKIIFFFRISFKEKKFFLLIIIFFLLSLIVANYLACFAPPIAYDEIAYHLPEAKIIATNHQLPAPTKGEFYVNLPCFMEIAFAMGIILTNDYSFGHILHYLFLLNFLLFIIGWLSNKKNKLPIILTICSIIMLLSGFVDNATSSYVDSAYIVLEIIALIIISEWLMENKKNNKLIICGLILGMAIAIKYSSLFTVLFITVSIIGKFIYQKNRLRNNIKLFLSFIIPIFIFGGYFYIKNFLFFQNPVYPLYFSHSGFSDVEFQSLMNAIHSFSVPISFSNFLLIPKYFYYSWLFSPFSINGSIQNIILSICIIFIPFILLYKKNRLQNIYLFCFIIIYFIYWFFFATHQLRFLGTVNILITILASIVFFTINSKKAIILRGLAILLILSVFCFIQIPTVINIGNMLKEAFANHYRHDQNKFVFGLISKREYLSSYLGCGLNVLEYLNNNDYEHSLVLDNWSTWHQGRFLFYDKYKLFKRLPDDLRQKDIDKYIIDNNIKYIYINNDDKNNFILDPVSEKYYLSRINQEDYLLEKSELIYNKDSCYLYQIKKS